MSVEGLSAEAVAPAEGTPPHLRVAAAARGLSQAVQVEGLPLAQTTHWW